jgi:hypothetical protein
VAKLAVGTTHFTRHVIKWEKSVFLVESKIAGDYNVSESIRSNIIKKSRKIGGVGFKREHLSRFANTIGGKNGVDTHVGADVIEYRTSSHNLMYPLAGTGLFCKQRRVPDKFEPVPTTELKV